MWRAFGWPAFLATVAGLALAGCTTSVSTDVVNAGDGGILYYLPKARMKIAAFAGYSAVIGGPKDDRAAFLMMNQLRFDVLAPTLSADTSKGYYLSMQPSAMSDDHFCIAMTPDGMLSQVGVVTADRSGAIVQRLAETIATFATGAPISAADQESIQKAQRFSTENLVVLPSVFDAQPFAVLEFDPDEPAEISSARTLVEVGLSKRIAQAEAAPLFSAMGLQQKIEAKSAAVSATEELKGTKGAPLFSFAGEGERGQPRIKSGVDGVVYRSVAERKFTVSSFDAKPKTLFMMMPDPSTDSFIDFSRAPLIRKAITMKLNNGMLASVEVDKPSEGLAAASLPLNVAGAIIETPARFFTAIAAATKSETALLNAKAELLQAEAELLKVRQGEDGKVPAGAAFSNSTAIASNPTAPAAFTSGLTCAGS